MRRLIFLSLFLSLWGFGCDDDDGDNNGGGATQAEYDAALDAHFRKWCTNLIDCCTGSYTSMEPCLNDQYASLAEETSENVVIDYDQGIECLEARTAWLPDTCDDEYINASVLLADECSGVVVGQLGVGAACSSQNVCEPGTFCYYDWDLDDYTVCTAQGALGDPCEDQDWGDPCVWGLVCDEGFCVNPRAIGEACDYAFQCGADYLSEVWCIDDVCDYLRANGEGCIYDDDCLFQNCDGDVCVMETFEAVCY